MQRARGKLLVTSLKVVGGTRRFRIEHRVDFDVIRGMVYKKKKRKKEEEEEARKSKEPVTREKYTGGKIKIRALGLDGGEKFTTLM